MSKALGIKKNTIKSRTTRQAGPPKRAPRVPRVPRVPRENVADLSKYKRATYYLKPATIQTLKIIAARRGVELTVLVRGIIEGYISKQRDSE